MYGCRHIILLLAVVLLMMGCTSSHQGENERHGNPREHIKRLAGAVDVTPPEAILEKGQVLMSYSDCFGCHKESDRKRGPAFSDIAARYPMNSTYIRILSKRIILGSKGAWGNAVMPPHPKVSDDDAEAMVMYILSLD